MADEKDELLEAIGKLTAESAATQQIFQDTAAGLREDIGKLNDNYVETNRELGGIQAELISIKGYNESQDKRLSNIEKIHTDCKARHGYKAVNARLYNLETDYKTDLRARANATGSTDVAAQQALARMEARDSGSSSRVYKEVLAKFLPWLLVAALGGAALGGFLLAKGQFQPSPVGEKVENKK